MSAEHLLADKGYDTDAILEQAKAQKMNPVIPPKKNRTTQRPYDEDLYKLRHLVENAFLHLKRWRGIATRYAKNTASFLAAVHIQCLVTTLSTTATGCIRTWVTRVQMRLSETVNWPPRLNGMSVLT